VAGEGRLRDAGRVGRPHGLDGSFHVRQAKDPFAEGTLVTVAGSEHRVQRRAGTDAAPLLRLEGVATREAAAALTGERLAVADAAAPLEEDEWLAADLIGCEVSGAGTVTKVVSGPSCDVLELDDGTLVPLVGDAIKSIDPEARRIEIDRHFLGLA
jgi:16S rRNA processing protein RimM